MLGYTYTWRSGLQERRIGVSLTGLALPHIGAYPRSRPRYPSSSAVVIFVVIVGVLPEEWFVLLY